MNPAFNTRSVVGFTGFQGFEGWVLQGQHVLGSPSSSCFSSGPR